MYVVRIAPATLKALEKLKRRVHPVDFDRLLRAIDSLADEPRPHVVLKLKGTENGYRVRVGEYRVIYRVDDQERMVSVGRVRRRDESTYDL